MKIFLILNCFNYVIRILLFLIIYIDLKFNEDETQ
jgi:hypothetical protein